MSKQFSNIKQYYDSYYQENQGNSFPNDIKRTSSILTPFLATDANGQKNLDIGCGVGYASEILHANNFDIYGIDIADDAIKLAQQRIPSGNFTLANSNGQIKFDDSYFNNITCLGVLEHIENPESIVSESYRVLKNNGKALFSVPNSINPYFAIAGGTGQIREVPLRLGQWKKMFENAGFKVISIGKDPGPTILRTFPLIKKIKVALNKLINLFPVYFTYQFVFVLEKKQ